MISMLTVHTSAIIQNIYLAYFRKSWMRETVLGALLHYEEDHQKSKVIRIALLKPAPAQNRL